jgi:hypothetical protein
MSDWRGTDPGEPNALSGRAFDWDRFPGLKPRAESRPQRFRVANAGWASCPFGVEKPLQKTLVNVHGQLPDIGLLSLGSD